MLLMEHAHVCIAVNELHLFNGWIALMLGMNYNYLGLKWMWALWMLLTCFAWLCLDVGYDNMYDNALFGWFCIAMVC